MNKKLKRFIEVTFPMIILYGFVVLIVTYKIGFEWGLIAIGIWTIVDVLMTKNKE